MNQEIEQLKSAKSLAEAAEILCLAESDLRDLINAGQVKAFKVDNEWWTTTAWLDEWQARLDREAALAKLPRPGQWVKYHPRSFKKKIAVSPLASIIIMLSFFIIGFGGIYLSGAPDHALDLADNFIWWPAAAEEVGQQATIALAPTVGFVDFMVSSEQLVLGEVVEQSGRIINRDKINDESLTIWCWNFYHFNRQRLGRVAGEMEFFGD